MNSDSLLGREWKAKKFIWLLVIFFMFSQFCIRVFHMPGFVTYMGDVIILAFLAFVLFAKKGLTCLRSYASEVLAVVIFFLIQTLVGYLGNLYSPLLYAWGARKVFAPYIYLFTCIVVLSIMDARKLISVLEKIYVLSFCLVVIQYLTGYRGDEIGGVYGIGVGTNGFLNVFVCQICAVVSVQYLNNKASLKKTLAFLGMALVIAALVELKAIFVELVIIVGMALVLCKPSPKTLYIILACALGVAVAVPVMYKLYPSFANFFELDFLLSYLSMDKGYAMTGDLNRIGGMSYIYDNFLVSGFEKIFGIGLGNAEYSGYSFFTSDFYRTYQDSLHYAWFAHLMYLLENGILGFVCFIGVFAATALKCLRMKIRKHEHSDLLVIACMSCCLGVFYSVYNNTIRDYNTTMLLYLFIALPFIVDKDVKERTKRKVLRPQVDEKKMDDTCVSVVVPVYNVENFLRECIDSLLAQTHRNIEIILVDDGSKDNSGKICDEYAKDHSNVKVIHKENGGLSSARNAGIAAATGEYIGFIDSDDWIEPDMFQKLLEAALALNAQISTCAMIITTEDGQAIENRHELQEEEVYSSKEAIEEILSFGNVDVSFCDKLFKKDLLNGIEFPLGKINEDAAIIYRVFVRATRIVNTGVPMYYYRNRTNSISKSAYTHEKIQVLDHADKNEEFLLKNHHDLVTGCRRYKAYASCNVVCSMLKDPTVKVRFPDDFNRYMKELRSNYLYLISNPYVSLSWKLRGTMVVLGLYAPIYALISNIRSLKAG